jgi:shikimate dehydrogenase
MRFTSLFVLGDPVAHSLSPELHARALAWAGLRGACNPIRVRAAGLPEALDALAALGFHGGSVTVPHKGAAAHLVSAMSNDARRIGAVNCLTRRGAGFVGDNTDGAGFAAAVARRGGGRLAGRRAVLFGAGGAARAVLHALVRARASEVLILNRSDARAAALAAAAREWGRRTCVTHAPLAQTAAVAREHARRPFDIVVNATTVGLAAPGRSIAPAALLRGARVAVDAVYSKGETRFVRDARRHRACVVDGLDLLVGQGRLAFRRWFGRTPPWDLLEEAVRAAWRQRLLARRATRRSRVPRP